MSTPNPIEDAVSKLQEKFGRDVEEDMYSAVEETEEPEESALIDEESEDEVEEGEPAETEEDDESEEPDGLEEEPPEEAGWSSLAEVLEAGSIDPEKLPVEVTVAGEKQQVTLKEALNGYQRQADYDRHMASLREVNKAISEERKKLSDRYSELQDSFMLANGYWDTEKKVLQQRKESIDWGKLRAENPSEYAAALAEFDQEEKLIDQQQKSVQEEFEKVKAKAIEDAKKAQEERAQEEGKRLLEAIPEWASDKETFMRESTEIGQFLQSSGYSAEELQQFVDHRALVLARKAMLYEKSKKIGTQIGENSPRPKPKKLLRPGARTPTKGRPANTKKARELAAKAKKSGREDVAAQRLLLKLGG
jgi:hypothetical protein